ncbi:hypothetical protein HDK77DRAFT_3918 [Phyllosticta capitalensis]
MQKLTSGGRTRIPLKKQTSNHEASARAIKQASNQNRSPPTSTSDFPPLADDTDAGTTRVGARSTNMRRAACLRSTKRARRGGWPGPWNLRHNSTPASSVIYDARPESRRHRRVMLQSWSCWARSAGADDDGDRNEPGFQFVTGFSSIVSREGSFAARWRSLGAVGRKWRVSRDVDVTGDEWEMEKNREGEKGKKKKFTTYRACRHDFRSWSRSRPDLTDTRNPSVC